MIIDGILSGQTGSLISTAAKNDTPKASQTGALKPYDEVDISVAAQAKFAMVSEVNALKNPENKTYTRQDIDKMSTNIMEKIGKVLMNNQIYKYGDFEVSLNDYGKLEVSGDMPNKEAIEKALNADPELVKDVAEALGAAKKVALEEVQREYQLRLDGKSDEEDEEEKAERRKNEMQYLENLTVKVQNISQQVMKANSLSVSSGGEIGYMAMSIASAFTGL